MYPFFGFALALVMLNLWLKRRIDRKLKAEQNKPNWRDQFDREGYDDALTELKLKHMREGAQTDDSDSPGLQDPIEQIPEHRADSNQCNR